MEDGPDRAFQRAIRRLERAMKEEAWEQGRDAGFDTGNEYGQGHEFPVSTDNPYREGAKGDGEG